jgi:hypothetical protein
MQKPTSHNDYDHHNRDYEQHEHDSEEGHGHEHGRVNANLYGNRTGLRAVQISTAGMLIVATIQFAIATLGGSAELFADCGSTQKQNGSLPCGDQSMHSGNCASQAPRKRSNWCCSQLNRRDSHLCLPCLLTKR